MEEIRIRDEQLEKLINDMKETLAALKKSERKKQDIDKIKDDLKSAKNALDAMEIELNHQAQADKRTYKKKFKQYKADIKEVENELEWKQQDENRKDLLGDHEAKVRDLESEGGLIKYGLEVEDESKNSLQRSVAVVAATLEVGKETAAKVERQTEQIAGILEGLDKIEDSLDRSRIILARIGRRVLTDKYIWVFIGLILVAIIFIIAWKKTHSGTDVNTPPVPCPPGTTC